MGIYGIAKAGMEMLTRVLAQELAPFKVQVNAVAPCMVKTGFSQPFWGNAELADEIIRTIPLGRIAEPEDVVHPTLFLCSSGADFITGQTIMVDGGASAV
jgi:NAD(P)-dependent dehydrogenase (short-subunit alcohol dehydrogenase family)